MFRYFNKLLINNICIEGIFLLMEDIYCSNIIYYSFKGNFLRHLIAIMKTITITKQDELKGIFICVYKLKNREREK